MLEHVLPLSYLFGFLHAFKINPIYYNFKKINYLKYTKLVSFESLVLRTPDMGHTRELRRTPLLSPLSLPMEHMKVVSVDLDLRPLPLQRSCYGFGFSVQCS